MYTIQRIMIIIVIINVIVFKEQVTAGTSQQTKKNKALILILFLQIYTVSLKFIKLIFLRLTFECRRKLQFQCSRTESPPSKSSWTPDPE